MEEPRQLEDWQEWQIRADKVAEDLRAALDELTSTYLNQEGAEFDARGFWPRFRDMKERVRIAPAIRLEAKLELERRLRTIGAKAYKAQEVVNAESGERKKDLLTRIAELRATAEKESSPRALRGFRRSFDALRQEFDKGADLVPSDRQAVWDAWRDANQFSWQRLVDMWDANEQELRSILTDVRQQIERGNGPAARQGLTRFFEALRTHEAKQQSMNEMKGEADELRQEAQAVEDKAVAARAPRKTAPITTPTVSLPEGWKSDLERNREMAARLREEVADLERQVEESKSILDQSMLRGTLVDKRRKINDLESASRTLEQKIEQSEEAPLIPST